MLLVLVVQLLTHSTAFTLHSFIFTRLNGVRPRKMIVNDVSDWTRDVMDEGDLVITSALDSRMSAGLDSIMPLLDSARTRELPENTDPSASNSTLNPNTTTPDTCRPTPTHTHSHDWQTKAGDLLDRLSVPSVAMVTQCDRSKAAEIWFASLYYNSLQESYLLYRGLLFLRIEKKVPVAPY